MTKKRGMWYIFLGVLLFICLGSVYSWSIFSGYVKDSFGVKSATVLKMPYMVFLVSYAFSMPVFGRLIDKWGARRITIIGAVVFSSSWILSGFASNIVFLTITYGLIAGTGVGIAYGAPMSVVAKWFPDKKGFVVGMTLAGFGVSPLIMAPFADFMLQHFSVVQSFRIMGVIFLVVTLFCAVQIRDPKPGEVAENVIDKTDHSSEIDLNIKQILKTKQGYGLWICFVIGTLAGLMAIGMSKDFGKEVVKLPDFYATISVSLFAMFNGGGRPIYGAITDKLGVRKAAIISFMMIFLSSMILINANEGTNILYIVTFAALWFNLGGWLAIAPTATRNLFGKKFSNANYGYIFTGYGIGAIGGAFLAGKIIDITGDMKKVFPPVMVLAFVGIFIAYLTLERPDHKDIEEY